MNRAADIAAQAKYSGVEIPELTFDHLIAFLEKIKASQRYGWGS